MRLSKQNKIVVGVIALVLALTVGYALFSESLNINGTAKASGDFGLEFVSVDAIRKEGYTDASSNGSASEEEIKQKIASIVDENDNVVEKGKKLKVTVDKLNYPGAYVEIDATIKNVGTIDAILKGIEVTSEDGVVNDTTISNDDIEITYSGVAKDNVMRSDENDESNTRQITIKVKWKEESVNKSPAALTFNIALNFEQATGNLAGGTTGGDEFKFPVVEGQLGENVFFKYDNGAIDITGSGPMREGAGENDTLAISIGKEAVNNISLLNTGDENKNSGMSKLLGFFIVGKSYDYLGVTKEEFRNMLISTDESNGGLGLSEEKADNILMVFDAVPKFKSVTIANGVTSTMRYLFQMFNMDTLTIPSSVTNIGNGIFDFATVNTLILEDGTTTVLENITSGEDAVINNVIIPEGVTTIETNALKIKGATIITIPSTVTSIELGAISGSNLTTIVNKTGRVFDWKGIVSDRVPPVASGELFETGTVEYNGRTITITDK